LQTTNKSEIDKIQDVKPGSGHTGQWGSWMTNNSFLTSFAAGAAAAFVASTMSCSAAFATTYDFSYAFGGDGVGNTVTGSFTGTGPNLNDITVDSVLSMSINGTPVSGPLYFWSYGGNSPGVNNGGFTLGSAILSADSSLTDFSFSNSDSSANGLYTEYFYVIQPWYNSGSVVATQFGYGNDTFINTYNGQYVAANFSVTLAGVPEPGAWATMILGLAGLGGALRRRGGRPLATA
jgi:hypothetical protein